MKKAKSGHFYIQPNTPTPRRGALPSRRFLRLSEPSPSFLNFLVRLGVAMLRLGKLLRLGEPLRLGVAVSSVFVPLFR